jgi:hypothetical protein
MKRLLFFLLVLFLYPDGTALAVPNVNSFRCGSQIVMIGYTKPEVLNKCGEPTSREVVATEEKGYFLENNSPLPDDPARQGVYRGVTRKIEEWYYNCGSNNFSYILIFEGNELKRIEQVGYGKGESDCNGPGSRRLQKETFTPMKRLRELSDQTGRPLDELLEEAVEDLLKKYNHNSSLR